MVPQREDDIRIKDDYLFVQPLGTDLLLIITRVAVLWRSAEKNISNPIVILSQSNILKKFIELLSSGTDKRNTCFILTSSWNLGYDHNFRILAIPASKDNLVAGF